jgi:hypothetical protein
MATEWYYTVNGQQAPTPVSAAQLKQMAGEGQLQPTDLLWQEGMTNWVSASSIKGLFPPPSRSPVEEQLALIDSAIATKPKKAPPRKRERERDRDEEDDDGDNRTPSRRSESGGGIVGMHPVLVLLLSTCTLGLFGLFYLYLVCSNFSAKATRKVDTDGKRLGKSRHPLGVFFLAVITFGFYAYYWIYKVMQECGTYTGRATLSARTELTLMLLFPPYSAYVLLFRVPELIRPVLQETKVPEPGAINNTYFFLLFVNPCLAPGLLFLAMIYQDALNQAWAQSP